MNITFFIGNEVLNIFLFNNLFKKIKIFGENEKKKISGRHDYFLEEVLR